MPSSDKWENFERLVAAVHRAADEGADVRWNDSIQGRQFDVTIRFRKGLYDYLTVVECKSHERPISVDKVDAFVTKAADVHANCAVIASSSGFQSGAQDAARKHNVTLIQVTESSEIDFSVFGARVVGVTNTLHIQSVELLYTDGERKKLPEESHKLTYYVDKICFRCGDERATLDEILQGQSGRFFGGEVDVYQEHVIECPLDTVVIGPDDGEIALKSLDRIHVRAGIRKATVIDGPAKVDPYLFVPDVKVRNVITGQEHSFSQNRLAFGVNNAFVVGQFYEQPQVAMYYFCESIEGQVAHLYLVESFQHGQLIQAELMMETKYADLYVPVTDTTVLQRLERRLNVLKGLAAPTDGD